MYITIHYVCMQRCTSVCRHLKRLDKNLGSFGARVTGVSGTADAMLGSPLALLTDCTASTVTTELFIQLLSCCCLISELRLSKAVTGETAHQLGALDVPPGALGPVPITHTWQLMTVWNFSSRGPVTSSGMPPEHTTCMLAKHCYA